MPAVELDAPAQRHLRCMTSHNMPHFSGNTRHWDVQLHAEMKQMLMQEMLVPLHELESNDRCEECSVQAHLPGHLGAWKLIKLVQLLFSCVDSLIDFFKGGFDGVIRLQ